MSNKPSSTYSEKLKDPRWQKKRLEILERDNWQCQICGDTKSTLHVHHKIYEKGAEPWEIDSDFLVALCADCHDFETVENRVVNDRLIRSMRKCFDSVTINKITEFMESVREDLKLSGSSFTVEAEYLLSDGTPIPMRRKVFKNENG